MESGAATDFDRPLSNRGVADAVRMGDELNHLSKTTIKLFTLSYFRAISLSILKVKNR